MLRKSDWKKLFLIKMHEEIGKRYALGGGQMEVWNGHNNLDGNNNWVGFDCCGGIMFALREATGINLIPRNVPGMMKAPWVFDIIEYQLKPNDLVFVDVPKKDINGDIIIGEDGYPVYGVWNHVMTYIGKNKQGYDIITTKGPGGDFRLNPKSKTITDYWVLSEFKKVSAHIYEDTTRYKYMRINWKWLEDWKDNH